MSGCTTLDTLTAVCSSTPPLPATGIDPMHYFPAVVILWIVGWGLVWLARQ